MITYQRRRGTPTADPSMNTRATALRGRTNRRSNDWPFCTSLGHLELWLLVPLLVGASKAYTEVVPEAVVKKASAVHLVHRYAR